MGKRGLYEGFKYSTDNQQTCQHCGRVFGNIQALKSHLRLSKRCPGSLSYEGPSVANQEGVAVPDAAMPASMPTSIDNRQLEALVKRRKLEAELRRLEAEFPTQAQPRDIMSLAGLGNFSGSALELAQKRALGLVEPPRAEESILSKILSNPEALKVAVEGLRGILGTNGQGNGLDILERLGINLAELWQRAQAPRGPDGFAIGGISLAGVPLTEAVAAQLIAYASSKEQRASDLAKSDAMVEGLKAVAIAIAGSPENFSKIKDAALAPIRGRSPAQGEVAESVIICDKCGSENTVPADIRPGEQIRCRGAGCDRVWTAEDSSQPKSSQPTAKSKQQRQVKVLPPEPETMVCSECGQLIDISGRQLLDIVTCPACEAEVRIMDPAVPLPAKERKLREEPTFTDAGRRGRSRADATK